MKKITVLLIAFITLLTSCGEISTYSCKDMGTGDQIPVSSKSEIKGWQNEKWDVLKEDDQIIITSWEDRFGKKHWALSEGESVGDTLYKDHMSTNSMHIAVQQRSVVFEGESSGGS